MDQSILMLSLTLVSVLVYLALVASTVLEVGVVVARLLDHHVSREFDEHGVDGYVQTVVLPLLGALAGGLLGASIQSVADAVVAARVPGVRGISVISVELCAGLGLASVLPVVIRRRYARVAESSLAARLYTLRQRPERGDKARLVADIRVQMQDAEGALTRGRRWLVLLVVVAAMLLVLRIVLSEFDRPAGEGVTRAVVLFVLYLCIAAAGQFVLKPLNVRASMTRLASYERRALSINAYEDPRSRRRRSAAHRILGKLRPHPRMTGSSY